jgi:hypothetical protein
LPFDHFLRFLQAIRLRTTFSKPNNCEQRRVKEQEKEKKTERREGQKRGTEERIEEKEGRETSFCCLPYVYF